MFHKLVIAAAALLSSTAASAEWQQASSKHFVVYSDDSPEHVRAFTTRLEKFDKAVKVLREVPEVERGPAARLTVFVVDGVSDVQRLMNGGGRNVAGFYQPRASGSVAFVPRHFGGGSSYEPSVQRILLHEYAHHFMFADWPTAIFPKWFVEGFAEFHSTAIFNADGSVTFGAPPTDRASGVMLVNQMPLSRMLKPNPGKLSDLDTYALYSRGWLFTHYLTFDADRRKQLATYIAAINAGESLEKASAVFGNLNALDFKLNSYVKRPSFQSAIIFADKLAIGEIKLRALSPAEAAIMPAMIRSTAGVGPATAPKVAALARQTAAPFPSDPVAQNELAEAEYDAGNYPQAEAAADRAMAADPKSVHAALYKGMALQAVAVAAKSKDAAQWQAIRRWYIAANKMNVEDPQPLILYYQSFRAAQQQPPKSADAGLLYASALAPFDLDLRLLAGRVYLQQGKIAQAREAMLPVAYNPHAEAAAERVRGVLAILDKDGAAAALADLDKKIDDAEKEETKNKGG